ncbi:MAG: polyphenol oxidase family protein [Acidimicrobiia bacterium]
MALHVDDDPQRVRAHRERLASSLRLPPPATWCWLEQVHGATVVQGDAAVGVEPPPRADAAVTATRGLPLVVLTADCLPIALASDDAVGVVHAGWQGLMAGVIEAAVGRLRAVGTGAVRAAIGPCAGPSRYEFGRVDLDRVVERLGAEVEAATSDGRPSLDLPGAARRVLEHLGVAAVWESGVCTIASPDHFSYRREGRTGRQALVAWIPPGRIGEPDEGTRMREPG